MAIRLAEPCVRTKATPVERRSKGLVTSRSARAVGLIASIVLLGLVRLASVAYGLGVAQVSAYSWMNRQSVAIARRAIQPLADAGHSHEQQVEKILQKIVDRGGRRTMSRQAVIRVIVDSHGHVTADDIATEVKKDFPSVDVSTVYRTLETLRDIDIVDRVYFADGSTVYHLKDHQHHHLCCESCGAVQELPITLLESVENFLFAEFGFRVTQRPLGFFGVCSECAKA